MAPDMVQLLVGDRLERADQPATETVRLTLDLEALGVLCAVQDHDAVGAEAGLAEAVSTAAERDLIRENADDEAQRIRKRVEPGNVGRHGLPPRRRSREIRQYPCGHFAQRQP
jgi:hypothetical protein